MMKGHLRFGSVSLLILLALFIGASFGANQTASNEKINVTKSTNITNPTTSIPVINISQLKNMAITTSVSNIKAVNVSTTLTIPDIDWGLLEPRP
jgi:hypothetical protein